MKLEHVDLQVFYGVITDNLHNSENPIIVISTSYDSLSIAPQMTQGINQGSSIFVLSEISKIIKGLNADPDLNLKERAKYDIMFVLTPGSSSDYEVTNQFISTMNALIVEKIKLVICIDSLGFKGPLTAHVGNVNNEQEEFAKGIFKTLKLSASLNNKSISFTKKLLPDSFYEWEHLRYSEHNLIAFTITSNPSKTFSSKFDKFSLYDTVSHFDYEAFKQNTEIVAEFIVRALYGIEFTEAKYIQGIEFNDT